jgi:hypothetical protein
MRRFARAVLGSGLTAGILSELVAALRGRIEGGNARRPIHAVSHIAWNDAAGSHEGRKPHNFVVGSALHLGASTFWAAFFEALFGARAERSSAAALIGGATIAAGAYVTDYHVVSRRFEPGFEAHLTNRSLFMIYAALAVGLATSARLRGLYHHQIKNRDERHERRHPERRPDPVIAPE